MTGSVGRVAVLVWFGMSLVGCGRDKEIAEKDVKTAEHAENVVEILGIDSDAVILNRKAPAPLQRHGPNTNSRRLIRAILDRIPNQVLEKLDQQNLDRRDSGEASAFDSGARLLDARLQRGHRRPGS